MTRNPITVDPDVPLSDFVDGVVLKYGLNFVPVVEDGTLLGYIDHAMVLAIDREHWTNTQVGDVFAGLDDASIVDPAMPVEDLLKEIAGSGRRKFLVTTKGRLVGVISLSDLSRHLRLSDLLPAA